MNNEGRNPLPESQLRELVEQIRPELNMIYDAVRRIESKIGTTEGWPRTAIISHTVGTVFRSFSNILCGTFGWSERDGKREVNHSSSFAAPLFYSKDYDQVLATLLNEISNLITTEQYELVDKVQQERVIGNDNQNT